MAAEILKGIVDLGRPTKLGKVYVLVDPMADPTKAFVRIAASRDELAPSARKKRLTLRAAKE